MRALLVLLPLLAALPRVAHIADPELDEGSGFARGARHPEVLWSHNDSGGKPMLYAVGLHGERLGRVAVDGARNVDWEDITRDPQGFLWIADTGNNANARRDLTLYRVPEPSELTGRVAVDKVVRFHYPEQTGFPTPGQRSFDSEALFWDGPRLFLLTKHRDDLRTNLYVFPEGFQDEPRWTAPGLDESLALQRVGGFEVGGDPRLYGGQVTGAALSPKGDTLAVLTYHALFLFPRSADHWLAETPRVIAFMQATTQQCEAVEWDGEELVFSNEDGLLFRIPEPMDTDCTVFPSPGCR